MEKVRPWCGQLSDRGRLKNRTDRELQFRSVQFDCCEHCFEDWSGKERQTDRQTDGGRVRESTSARQEASLAAYSTATVRSVDDGSSMFSTCHSRHLAPVALTAKNRDQLRNPTLGNRVWATFTFLKVGRQYR